MGKYFVTLFAYSASTSAVSSLDRLATRIECFSSHELLTLRVKFIYIYCIFIYIGVSECQLLYSYTDFICSNTCFYLWI